MNLLDGGDPFTAGPAAPTARVSGAWVRSEPSSARRWQRALASTRSPGKVAVTKALAKKTRDQWVAHFAGKEACVAPVLSLGEAPAILHNRSRGTFVDVGGVPPARPHAALFAHALRPAGAAREATAPTLISILAELGYVAAEIAGLRRHRCCVNPLYESRCRRACSSGCRRSLPPRRGEPGAGLPGLRLAGRDPRCGRASAEGKIEPVCAVARPPALREAIARHYVAVTGLDIRRSGLRDERRDRGAGRCHPRRCQPGDESIIFTPAYDGYAPLIRRAGGVFREIALRPPGGASSRRRWRQRSIPERALSCSTIRKTLPPAVRRVRRA